jgi:DNA-binding MarR family transcriptional regulator
MSGGHSTRDTARLLLLLAEFGTTLSRSMAAVVPEPELVGNAPLLVLGRIELHGPQRPVDLAEATGMTSGGLSKLLDRMEDLGVVRRERGSVQGDRRAVVLELTDRGHELMQAMTEELAARLPETEGIIREILKLVEP